MIVLSVDPGVVNIGYSVFDVEQPLNEYLYTFFDSGSFKCSSEEEKFNDAMEEENFQCLEFFNKQLESWDVTHVAWETTPSFGTMGQQSRIISNLTVLKTLTWQRGLPFFTIHPTSMKTRFTGNSRATKKEVRAEVIRRWPEFNDDGVPKKLQRPPDVYDAIGIGVTAVESNEWKRFGGRGSEFQQL